MKNTSFRKVQTKRKQPEDHVEKESKKKQKKEDELDFFLKKKPEKTAEVEEEEDPFVNETADEKKVRLAKMHLERLTATKDDDFTDSEEEMLESRDPVRDSLKKDAFTEKSGRKYRFLVIADKVKNTPIEPTEMKTLRGHQLSVTAVRIAEDDSFIYSASKDCTIIKWSYPQLQRVHTFKKQPKDKKKISGHADFVWSLALSSDGKILASGGKEKVIHVWNTQLGTLTDTFKGHRDGISGLTFRLGTHELFSASLDRTIKLWDCDVHSYSNSYYGHQASITGIDCLKRELCTTSSSDKTVRQWKIPEETHLVFRGNNPSALECVANLTEEMWVTGAQNGNIQLWINTKKFPLFTIEEAHGKNGNIPNWISAIATIPFSDLFATGSCDGFIKLWKYSKNSALRSFELIKDIPVVGCINSLAFSKSGKFLVAGVGQDPRLGRWIVNKSARNGIRVIPLLK